MDLVQLPVTALADGLARGEFSSRELVDAYLARIERHNAAGAAVNALREVNPQATDAADAADRARARGEACGPLHGIPIVVKDNMATADGMRTCVGAIAFADYRADRDAHVVARLRRAGAIVLAKANLTEFADLVSDVMPSEFSAAGGRVRNPYGVEYGRGGGSSVGTAAAVAAGFCAAGLGSETVNSIQAPAAATSLVGLKPTVPLVSRTGIVPGCPSQDVAGPLTRTVADAALLLQAIAGVDVDDGATLAAAGRVAADYRAGLRGETLAGARIGIARDVYFDALEEDEAAVLDAALRALADAGAEVLDPVDIPTARTVRDLRSCVMRTEFRAGIDAWLRGLGAAAPVADLAGLMAFNQRDAATRIPYGQRLFEEAAAMPGMDAPAYHADRLRDVVLTRAAGLDAALDGVRLDALVVPQARAAKVTGKAGYPALTVPAGYRRDGRPVGLTFLGRAWSEATLLRLAHGLETVLQARRPPHLA